MEWLPRVVSLHRYPVKSLLGEQGMDLDLDRRGVVGDRLWSVRTTHNKIGSGKTTRRFEAVIGLLELRAVENNERVIVTFPDGSRCFTDGADAGDRLCRHFGRPLTFAKETEVSHFDDGPVSLIGHASIAAVAREPTREQCDELARRFFAATEQGDLAGLEALLAHDVVLTGDGGGKAAALARPLHGRDLVARALINWTRRSARLPDVTWRPVEVNGGPGALYLDGQQRVIGVVALEVAGREIANVRSIVNPDKLTHLGPVADFKSLLSSVR